MRKNEKNVEEQIEEEQQRETPPGQAEVPTFTIRADSKFGIRCMVMIRDLAVATYGLPVEEKQAISLKLRDFDLYEEQNRK
jgi:hypothetical protein